MFSCISQKIEFVTANNVRITVIIDEGHEFCPEFFFISKGYWGGLGAKLGHKNFNLNLQIKDRKGIFDASWNEESIFFKIKRGLRWLFNIKKALQEMTDSHEALVQQYEKLNISKKLLQIQSTQLKTAFEISNSIRLSLNINDTLKAITDALVVVADFSFASIELYKNIDEDDIDIKSQSGSLNIIMTPIRKEILFDDKKIGELIVYPKQKMDYKESMELMEYIFSVITVAVHDALVVKAIVDHKANLEQKISDRTSELRKAHQTQARFFTNISHEFRTPLTLILGPIKQLIEKTKDENAKDILLMVYRNAYKLLELVNELLDISKIDSGYMKLQTAPQNIIPILKAIVLSFSSYAERKQISLQFNYDLDKIIVYLEKDKIEKIINNILSNAFKFTPPGGKIEVTVTLKPSSFPPLVKGELKVGSIQIKISDTGIGIPKEKLSKIFDRFYQVDSSHTRGQEGTGIGLTLTKELVDLHKGTINVESEEGRGTTVTVNLPLGKDHLKSDEIIEQVEKQESEKHRFSEQITQVEESRTEAKNTFEFSQKDSLPLLLIVEDNADVRRYVKDNLDLEFRIIEAKDGEDGWNKSVDNIPDLIISDVMMPKMDGFKFCEKLKTDQRTSHIPVILLTAKAAKQDKLDGYELGADEYIMKPFEPDELKARIKNLIQQRERIHQHFKEHGLIELNLAKINAADKKFLQSIYELVIKNISEQDFTIDKLAEMINISRSVMHKKIIFLIGETPGELIRRLRINKAAELIEKRFGNLSEIALEVGFNNPAYFSEAFKKQFGVTPSQYQHKFSNS
jgi:signal transduction histidine kinase/DNA-binding response OmpR family regulator